jgi:hypothetical protein
LVSRWNRSRLALLAAAFALLGVQRVPCLLGAAAEAFGGTATAHAPCHALPAPSLPASSDGERDPAPACSGCPGVRALVFAGPGSAEPPSAPAPVLSSALLLVPAAAPRGAPALRALQRARDPDRLAATTVRLL